MRFSSIVCQSTRSNQTCLLMPLEPFASEPRRLFGSFSNRPSKRLRSCGEILFGYFICYVLMLSNSLERLSEKYGGRPVSISKIIHPSVHQSTALSYRFKYV
jgi:hypothetical protein